MTEYNHHRWTHEANQAHPMAEVPKPDPNRPRLIAENAHLREVNEALKVSIRGWGWACFYVGLIAMLELGALAIAAAYSFR